MHNRVLSMAAGLSDAELLRRVVFLAGQEREATVELVGHLAELDARKLHLAQGYGSLFTYCTGALRLAEHAAYNRIEAARLSRRFPAILDLLADGSLNLSTARLLAPHLRPDNFEMLVTQARGRSKREVEELVARLSPRPDLAASVRKLPARGQAVQVRPRPARWPRVMPTGFPWSPRPAQTCLRPLLRLPRLLPRYCCSRFPRTLPAESRRRRSSRHTGRRSRRWRRSATAYSSPSAPRPTKAAPGPGAPAPRDPGWRSRRDLRPGLDPLARRSRPQEAGRGREAAPPLVQDFKAPGPSMRTRSRHIPARVKRAVWLRDGGRCAFVSVKGRRCTERVFLEFHHREPYGLGGEATVANISLRCRAHNVVRGRAGFRPPKATTRNPRVANARVGGSRRAGDACAGCCWVRWLGSSAATGREKDELAPGRVHGDLPSLMTSTHFARRPRVPTLWYPASPHQ